MTLLLALLIGAIVGAILGYREQKDVDFLLVNIVAGVVGAVLGAVVYFLAAGLGNVRYSWRFNLISALCSLLGALLLVVAFNGLHRMMPKRTAHQSNVDKGKIDED